MASPSYPATPTSDHKTSTGMMSSVPNTNGTPSLSYYPSTASTIAATRPTISTAMAAGSGIAGTVPATPATPSPTTASASGASGAGNTKRGRKQKGPSGLSQSQQQQHAASMSPAPQTPTIGSYVPSGATGGGLGAGGGGTTQWAEPVMPDVFSSTSAGTGQARGQSVQPPGSVSRSAGTPAPGAGAATAGATATAVVAGGSGGGILVAGTGAGTGAGQTTMVPKEEEEQGEDDLLPAMADDDYSAQQTFQAQSKDDLKVLMENLSPAQYDRFEAYRRHALPKAAVRKVIQQSLGQSVSQPVAQIVAGFAKVFVGEIVEKARADQARRGQHGPLSPDNLREAYREYQEETGRVGAARPLKGKKLFVR